MLRQPAICVLAESTRYDHVVKQLHQQHRIEPARHARVSAAVGKDGIGHEALPQYWPRRDMSL
jgi:hypothetical protein